MSEGFIRLAPVKCAEIDSIFFLMMVEVCLWNHLIKKIIAMHEFCVWHHLKEKKKISKANSFYPSSWLYGCGAEIVMVEVSSCIAAHKGELLSHVSCKPGCCCRLWGARYRQ